MQKSKDKKRFYKQLFDVFGGCCIVYWIHCTTQCVWRRDHAHVRIHLSFGAQRDDIFCRRSDYFMADQSVGRGDSEDTLF